METNDRRNNDPISSRDNTEQPVDQPTANVYRYTEHVRDMVGITNDLYASQSTEKSCTNCYCLISLKLERPVVRM